MGDGERQMIDTVDFGNIVNTRKQTAEERFLHRPKFRTLAELAYEARAAQCAQLLHVIGEAMQVRNVGLATSLCEEAIVCLVGLREIISDGNFN
jgi:hypothetical protein